MSLIQLCEQDYQTKKALNTIALYCIAFDTSVMPSLTASVEHLLTIPNLSYTGKMYRAIKYPTPIADLRLVLSQMQQYWIDNNDHQYQSWSKTIDGMARALINNLDSGVSKLQPLIVYGQQGQGLDIGAAMNLDQRYADEYCDLVEEQELLAKFNNSVHIIGFINQKFYNVDQYHLFLQSLNNS